MKATVVSRYLSGHGVKSLPSGTSWTREGVRVRQSLDDVVVLASIDSLSVKTETIRLIGEALATSGWTVEPHPSGFRVSTPA